LNLTWWYRKDLALAVKTKHRNCSELPKLILESGCFDVVVRSDITAFVFRRLRLLSYAEGKHGHTGISHTCSSSNVLKGDFACMNNQIIMPKREGLILSRRRETSTLRATRLT
jgi:hypothetical protein